MRDCCCSQMHLDVFLFILLYILFALKGLLLFYFGYHYIIYSDCDQTILLAEGRSLNRSGLNKFVYEFWVLYLFYHNNYYKLSGITINYNKLP